MVRTIIIWVLIATLLIFLVAWLISGGLSRGIATAKTFFSPGDIFTGTASGTSFTLPWQTPPEGVDINTGEEGGGDSLTTEQEQQVSDLQDQYSQLSSQTDRVKLFGDPSPHAGSVTFVANAANELDPSLEYVQLQNSGSENISIANWSIQSVYSGGLYMLPGAAQPLITGEVNAMQNVTLPPGGVVTIASSPSPVGASFRENTCTGYLAQFQTFAPPLTEMCPDPASALPVTEQNLVTFGDTCIDFVRSIPSCRFVTAAQMPPSITPACRSFVGTNFSYNGCVALHQNERGFYGDSWRLYLGARRELWRNTHDVIRLLDESGRTVDVLSY